MLKLLSGEEQEQDYRRFIQDNIGKTSISALLRDLGASKALDALGDQKTMF
ncbi:MAG: hypothetical protein NZZ41_03520 [Candidatus Dojkabacteria bacterium]|nr:hypothetical protein [Candidatus Dojkabacteria bacterium]